MVVLKLMHALHLVDKIIWLYRRIKSVHVKILQFERAKALRLVVLSVESFISMETFIPIMGSDVLTTYNVSVLKYISFWFYLWIILSRFIAIRLKPYFYKVNEMNFIIRFYTNECYECLIWIILFNYVFMNIGLLRLIMNV